MKKIIFSLCIILFAHKSLAETKMDLGLEVYNNKLIVLVNNSHKIKIYAITTEGLSMPGIEISTEGSGPREMVVVDGKVYFTNWITSDVKVFNLFTYKISAYQLFSNKGYIPYLSQRFHTHRPS